MDLSVVVPTLDGRERLRRCLDALAEHVPDAEVIVVNGPSTDGTTGMVHDREDVAVLVEVADRNVNVARNAGIAAATGEVIAVVSYDLAVAEGWPDAVREELDGGADVVTGPTRRSMRVGTATEREESATVGGREVTYFNGDNVAFRRETVEALDGFDEYLDTGGARDGSHRLAALDREVVWNGDMAVTGELGTDGGRTDRDWTASYRSFAYRLVKSYGVRPAVARQLLGRAAGDCLSSARDVLDGDREFSSWIRSLRGAATGTLAGTRDGFKARLGDRATRRNPHGLSSRYDRAVETYDWR